MTRLTRYFQSIVRLSSNQEDGMADALTILVVDDSEAMRAVLGVILDASGYQVVFADSVNMGLEVQRREKPDLILTDFNMPGRTGRDLVASLRAEGLDTPIFVVSSESDPAIRAAMTCAGADGWVQKPVCAATLLAALQPFRAEPAGSSSPDRKAVSARRIPA